MRFPGFVGPSYVGPSRNYDCQRSVNLYLEADETGAGKDKEPAALVGTPGLRLLRTLPTSPVRGVFTASKGNLYAVGGNKLYQISSAFVATEIGTLLTTTGNVSMADNGIQLVVVDGPNGYAHTIGGTTTAQITDDAWMGADQVAYQDGYFIFNKPNSGTFYISGLNDVTLDALDIASAEGSPDNLVAHICDHRELWLFGKQSIEVWFDAGEADFPFQRIQGAYLEHGCAARFSVAKMNNATFWVGQDDKGAGMVFMATGYQPQRISTHAVERAIQSYADISTATAFTYQENGHQFYVINFAEATWVYDTTTGAWHERSYTLDGLQYRHRGNFHAFAFSKHIVGDWENGKIYELSQTAYTDDGAPITRMRITPHVSGDSKRVFYSSLQLDIETGVGLDGLGQGVDPQAMLTFSNDFGHTWSSEEWKSFGRIGATAQRVIWRRLGSSRDRVFKVVITDPVKVVITGAEIELEAGAN